MSIFVVDTHALVWYLSRDSRLSKRAEELLDIISKYIKMLKKTR